MTEENVRWQSKKKYPCKPNKGEHEWGKPELLFDTPIVRYNYKSERGVLDTGEWEKDYELLEVRIEVIAETKCIHCGKKVVSFLKDIILKR